MEFTSRAALKGTGMGSVGLWGPTEQCLWEHHSGALWEEDGTACREVHGDPESL